MPISQSRIIALINSALDYKQAAERLRDSIQHAFDAARTNQSKSFYLLTDLLSYSNFESSLKPDTLATLTVEYHHFRRNAKRNERAAQKDAFRRRSAGVIPRSTTPRDTRLSNSAYLPPAGTLQRPHISISPTFKNISSEDQARIFAEAQATADRMAIAEAAMHDNTSLPVIVESECPHCHIADIQQCRQPNCFWTSRIIADSELEAQQGDPTF